MTRAGVNWSRVVVGGFVWAGVYSVIGGIAMVLYFARELVAELELLGRPLHLTPDSILSLGVFGVVFTVAWGIVTVWLYAAIRPRYGPGPKTAFVAAVGVWLLSLVAPLSHLAAFGIASPRFVAIDLPTEFVAIVAATLAGARAYRE